MRAIILEHNLGQPFTIWERAPQDDGPDVVTPNVIIDEGQGTINLSEYILIDQGQGDIDLNEYLAIIEEF